MHLDSESDELVLQRSIQDFNDQLVMIFHLDIDYLWVGTMDGKLQAYLLEDELPLTL